MKRRCVCRRSNAEAAEAEAEPSGNMCRRLRMRIYSIGARKRRQACATPHHEFVRYVSAVQVPAQCLFEDVRMTLLHTGPHSSAGLDSEASTSKDSLIVRR